MRALVLVLIGVTGCGADETVTNSLQSGLQYTGSILMQPGPDRRVELSAPLFPDAGVFQQFQLGGYGALTDPDKLELVDEDVYTFESLLSVCAAKRPAIKLATSPTTPLTAADIATNYDEVARCAYEDFGAKPYWVPVQVDEIDVCARKLGPDWKLPSEAEIDAFTEETFEFFQATLTAQPSKDWFPTHFYYSLDVYVRGADGVLMLGNLSPQTQHVVPLPVSGAELDALYVGDGRPIGLRCLRLPAVGS